MLFLLFYITILWLLILIGGFVIINIIAKIEMENKYLESMIKAIIAIGMSIAWIIIMVILRNLYVRKVI